MNTYQNFYGIKQDIYKLIKSTLYEDQKRLLTILEDPKISSLFKDGKPNGIFLPKLTKFIFEDKGYPILEGDEFAWVGFFKDNTFGLKYIFIRDIDLLYIVKNKEFWWHTKTISALGLMKLLKENKFDISGFNK